VRGKRRGQEVKVKSKKKNEVAKRDRGRGKKRGRAKKAGAQFSVFSGDGGGKGDGRQDHESQTKSQKGSRKELNKKMKTSRDKVGKIACPESSTAAEKTHHLRGKRKPVVEKKMGTLVKKILGGKMDRSEELKQAPYADQTDSATQGRKKGARLRFQKKKKLQLRDGGKRDNKYHTKKKRTEKTKWRLGGVGRGPRIARHIKKKGVRDRGPKVGNAHGQSQGEKKGSNLSIHLFWLGKGGWIVRGYTYPFTTGRKKKGGGKGKISSGESGTFNWERKVPEVNNTPAARGEFVNIGGLENRQKKRSRRKEG